MCTACEPVCVCGVCVVLQECARYIETFKAYENRPASSIMEHTDTGAVDRQQCRLCTTRPTQSLHSLQEALVFVLAHHSAVLSMRTNSKACWQHVVGTHWPHTFSFQPQASVCVAVQCIRLYDRPPPPSHFSCAAPCPSPCSFPALPPVQTTWAGWLLHSQASEASTGVTPTAWLGTLAPLQMP